MTTELEEDDITTAEILAHYGVKGMKWGKRKDRSGVDSAGGSSKSKRKLPASEDHEVATELRKKPLHAMSNVELKRLNERLQLETQYAQLTAKQTQTGQASNAKARLIRGKKVLDNTLAVADTANKVITTLNSPAAKEVKKLLDSK